MNTRLKALAAMGLWLISVMWVEGKANEWGGFMENYLLVMESQM